MAQPRDVRNPIVKTYITKTTSPDGQEKIHARVYSRGYDLDRRGSGSTVASAVRRALAGVPASTPLKR